MIPSAKLAHFWRRNRSRTSSHGEPTFGFASYSAKRCFKSSMRQRVKERLGFQKRTTFLCTEFEWVNALFARFRWHMNNQLESKLSADPVTELRHLAKFVGSVNMQQGKGRAGRIKSLLRKPKHDR